MNDTKQMREVVYTLATMDLKLKYQNSKLGFLWSFIRPLLQFCTYYIVFGVILHYSDSPDYPLRMFLGVLVWSYFTEGTSLGIGSYLGKKSIITKIQMRKELIPISAYVTATINFFLNFVIFLVMYHIFTPSFTRMYTFSNLIVFLLSMFFLGLFMLSMNIILANVNVLFRDIQTIWEIILIYGCFLTPIMYTLPIPDNFMALYLFANPLVVPIENIRSIFFETNVLYWENASYMVAYAIATLMWLLIAFRVNFKLRGKVADYL